MAWITPRTWITGELVTASLLNVHVRDDLTFLFTDGTRRLAAYGVTTFNTSIVEQTMLSTVITGGSMSTNRTLKLEGFFSLASDAGGARNVNTRLKFGGTTHLSGNVPLVVNSTYYCYFIALIQNITASSQKIIGHVTCASSAGGAAWNVISTTNTMVAGASGAINTTVDQTLALTMQMDASAAAFSITMQSGSLELI
jgi:hypothetical protein